MYRGERRYHVKRFFFLLNAAFAMTTKNSNDTIENRTRYLRACSAVPQPTATPRVPFRYKFTRTFGALRVRVLQFKVPEFCPDKRRCASPLRTVVSCLNSFASYRTVSRCAKQRAYSVFVWRWSLAHELTYYSLGLFIPLAPSIINPVTPSVITRPPKTKRNVHVTPYDSYSALPQPFVLRMTTRIACYFHHALSLSLSLSSFDVIFLLNISFSVFIVSL